MLHQSSFDGWQKSQLLGKGSFGTVFEAILPKSKTNKEELKVCCKVVEFGENIKPEDFQKLNNEIDLMKKLDHPNVVQYLGSVEDQEKRALYIFMEYVTGGTLTDFRKKMLLGESASSNPTSPEKKKEGDDDLKTATSSEASAVVDSGVAVDEVRQWTYQMLLGVKYLHDRHIIHRDIKCDNILMTPDGHLKMADFGCSKAVNTHAQSHNAKTMIGTPYWMAPEVIASENTGGGYDAKSDIWSVGCTVVEMLTGRPPWPHFSSMWVALFKIANSTGMPPGVPKDCPPDLTDFLALTFERDPLKRPSAEELLSHPFIKPAHEKAMAEAKAKYTAKPPIHGGKKGGNEPVQGGAKKEGGGGCCLVM